MHRTHCMFNKWYFPSRPLHAPMGIQSLIKYGQLDKIWLEELCFKFMFWAEVEHWRIDAFKLWSCRNLLRVPYATRRSNLNVQWKDWSWSWSSNTLATWCEEATLCKRPCCWKRLRAEWEEGNRGQDGRVASLIQWAWTWANSRRRWGSGRPGLLQSMGSQRTGHDLATEQQ